MQRKRIKLIDNTLKDLQLCTDVRNVILQKIKAAEKEHRTLCEKLKTSSFVMFPAENGSKGIILRRDIGQLTKNSSDLKKFVPRQTQMLSWDLQSNTIVPGQWIGNKKVKINNSMLSPNGNYFLYALEIPRGPYKDYIPHGVDYLTVISKPPYFTGLLVLRAIRAHGYDEVYNHMMGGKWLNDTTIKLNAIHDLNNIEAGTIPNWLTFADRNTVGVPKALTISHLSCLKVEDLKKIIAQHKIPVTNLSRKRKADILDVISQYKQEHPQTKEIARYEKLPFVDKQMRNVTMINGCIAIDGISIHDCTRNHFIRIAPPQNYSW